MPITICRHLLAIVFAFISVPYVLAEVHPGLKNAIDKGDYKTAKNLREKMNVQSVYLPASLSLEDAEFIYGPLTGYRWILSLDSYGCNHYDTHECSPEFLDKYITKICAGTTEFDIKACLDWMKTAPLTKLNELYSSICQNKESAKKCSLYVNRLPLENQYQRLKELDSKNLVEFATTMEIDTVVQEKIPKKECLDKWKEIYAVIKSSIETDSRYHHSRGYFNESIICSFDGTREKMKKCIGYLDQFSKNMQKECKSGNLTQDVQKKVKVKRPYKPYETVLRAMKKNLNMAPWFLMDESWIEKSKFVQKYLKEETDMAQLLVDQYSSDGKFEPNEAKNACLTYPTIGQTISKKYEVDILSCSQILNDYPTYLGANCDTSDTVNRIRHLPAGFRWKGTDWVQDTISLVCDEKIQKYRYISRTEILEDFARKSYGECSSEGQRQNQIFICKEGTWKLFNEVNTEGVAFEKNNLVKGKLDSTLFFFKDFRDNRVYRAVKIGEQTWMAENLAYDDSSQYLGLLEKSWCHDDNNFYCGYIGRYYTWSAAMDSIGLFTPNGRGCGDRKECHPTYPVRGICPEGWHLPDMTEWNTLYSAMKSSPYAMQAKGLTNWPKATDEYSFSVLPAGRHPNDGGYNYFGEGAFFWSSSEHNDYHAYVLELRTNLIDNINSDNKKNGISVRCIMD